jgi:hypothetical protein
MEGHHLPLLIHAAVRLEQDDGVPIMRPATFRSALRRIKDQTEVADAADAMETFSKVVTECPQQSHVHRVRGVVDDLNLPST